MCMSSKILSTLGRRLLLGTLAVLLASAFEQGSTSARADNNKKNVAPRNQPAPSPKNQPAPPNKNPPAPPHHQPPLPKPHPHAHKHPHVQAAMHKLHQAWVELAKAKPIFGGHRIAAMELVAEAYNHLNAGIQGTPGKNQPEMIPLLPLPPGHDFPHIRTALRRIHEAQHELKKAAPMHGHREAAIAELNAAITQLREGMHYARNDR